MNGWQLYETRTNTMISEKHKKPYYFFLLSPKPNVSLASEHFPAETLENDLPVEFILNKQVPLNTEECSYSMSGARCWGLLKNRNTSIKLSAGILIQNVYWRD